MTILYGAIGYTLLENSNKQKIIVFSDMHDKLAQCSEFMHIIDWLKAQLNQSWLFLLEEVDRVGSNLQELWTESSHTQDLKNFYLSNTDIIVPIDVRPMLIPMSWELYEDDSIDISFETYLTLVDNFFNFSHSYFINKIFIYNPYSIESTLLGKHYENLKKKYIEFKKKSKLLNKEKLTLIIKKYKHLLQHFNNVLDDIMEWYACAIIFTTKQNIIVHTGLIHSEKIIKLLITIYKYRQVSESGVTKLENFHKIRNGCVKVA